MRVHLMMAAAAVTLSGCDWYPPYHVWSEKLQGQAELARAQSNRQIATLQARQTAESAHFLADAEVTRAYGVAKANVIIGDSLKNNQPYLEYLFINNLDHTRNQVIYIPTEAGLPILEAGHRQ